MKNKTHHNQLLDLHKNGDWVCSTKIEYMRDHRKRYSELSAKGFLFEARRCDKLCGINHSSKLFMRRLAKRPPVMQFKEITHSDGTRSMQPYLFG